MLWDVTLPLFPEGECLQEDAELRDRKLDKMSHNRLSAIRQGMKEAWTRPRPLCFNDTRI